MALILLAANCKAALSEKSSTDFNYQYNAQALPEASVPAWTVAAGGDGNETSISAETLNLLSPTGSYYFWDLPAVDWRPEVNLSTGFTVEFSLKLDASSSFGLNLAFSGETGAGWALLKINADNTTWSTADNSYTTVDTNINSDSCHVFRLVKMPSVEGETTGAFTLYRDGVMIFDNITGQYPSADPDSRFYFGALGATYNANAQVEYVRWDTEGAFAPETIPEPTTMTLIGTVFLLLAIRMYNQRTRWITSR